MAVRERTRKSEKARRTDKPAKAPKLVKPAKKKPAPAPAVDTGPELLFESSEWDFDILKRTYDAIQDVAFDDLGLDIYPNQIEIISTEQMLDAYSSIGMPLMYQHWSFGKHFARDEKLYRKGYTGLAYEIVINSNPCISYNMEDNTMTMQTLVMAHAAFGHNHFFKNNYLFKQWTDADGILDYLQFAKNYITKCEEREGISAVEEILDAGHALMDQGVFRYPRRKLNLETERRRLRERQEHAERTYNDLWRTVPVKEDKVEHGEKELKAIERKKKLKLPEENILYFIEKNSPGLKNWQRELLRIVRNIAQYFYPQKQTKMMNEGCATFVHHHIMCALYEKGLITEGSMLEFTHMHTNVLLQMDFDNPRFGGINPYALGFAMMQDIKRICTDPSDEDREWFSNFAGCGDWRGVLKDAWANYRDESFIRQFLSPKLIRELRLFALADREGDTHYTISAIHDERGYRAIRDSLAQLYDIGFMEPNIQVADVDLLGERHLKLQHRMHDNVPLSEKNRDQVLLYLRQLWGYDVILTGIDAKTDRHRYKASTIPTEETD